MRYSEFIAKLDRGELPRLCYFIGPETFLKEECLRRIKKMLNFEEMVFDGSNFLMSDFFDFLIGQSLFSSKRLALVKKAAEIEKQQQEKMEKILRKTVNYTILMQDTKTIDEDQPLMKLCSDIGCIVEFRNLFRNEIISWIRLEVRKRGKSITYDAANYMYETIGNNLREIKNEIEKLLLFTGDRDDIYISDVQTSKAQNKKYNIYALEDAICEKNKKRAFDVLNNLLDYGLEPTLILDRIHRIVKRMLLAKFFLKEKLSREAIIKKLFIPTFKEEFFFKNLEGFSEDELKEDIQKTFEADIKIKSGEDPKNAIQLLLLSVLCE